MSTEPKETALVVIEPTTALAVFTNAEKVDPILDAIRKIVAEFKPDTTTAKGRKEIASIANKVARSKTYLDDIGKKLTDEYKEIPKKIDANRKRIRDELDALKAEVRRPLTEWEEEEKARVAQLQTRVDGFAAIAAAVAKDSSELIGWIDHLQKIEIDDTYQEMKAEAAIAKERALTLLRGRYESTAKAEAEAAELARLREEAAKRESEERDRRIAEAAAEKARRDAEEKAAREKAEAERKAQAEREAAELRELELKLAAERAERERLAAIERSEREKQAAVEAERKRQEEAERVRQAEEARVRAEAERRAADEANRERIHIEIRDFLMSEGLPLSNAAAVVSLLSTGSIPHVSVRY